MAKTKYSIEEIKADVARAMDEELIAKLSIAETLAILGSLDITITTYENLVNPDPQHQLRISTALELLWPLEARLRKQVEEVLDAYGKGPMERCGL